MRTHVIVAIALGASAAACACRRAPASPPARAAPVPPATPAAPALARPASRTAVPREYLVTVAAGAGEGAVREVYGRYGIARVRGLGSDVYLVTLSEDPGLQKMEELGRQDARIRAVQPNFVYEAS